MTTRFRLSRAIGILFPLGVAATFLPDLAMRSAAVNAIVGLSSVAVSVGAWRRAGRGEAREARGWRWVSVSFGLVSFRWFIAVFAAVALHRPMPAIAIALAIPANLGVAVGFLSMPLAPTSQGARVATSAEALAFALSSLCLQWITGVAALPGLVVLPTASRLLAVAPFFMNSIIMGVIVFLASPRPGRYLGTLGLLFLAAATSAVGNLIVLSHVLAGAHHTPRIAHIFTLLTIVPIALAIERGKPIDEERPGRAIELAGGLVAYLPALGLLGALFVRHATGGLAAVHPILWLVYPLVAIFLVRQVLLGAELQQLSARLEAQVAERSRAVLAAQEELQRRQRLEGLGRLAGGVAHDFNNLLTGVVGYTHLIERRSPAGSPALSHVANIRRAVERGASLTKQILSFARRQPGEPRRFAPAELVHDLQGMLASLVGDGTRLDLELAADAGYVHMDPAQLEQVVVNLAVNAHDAMPAGGRLAIRIAGENVEPRDAASHDARPGRFVRVEVVDEGAGMSAETQARLFEPFFTTKTPGQGSGLGLAASYGIVRQAGGFITVESALGHGSRFDVHLPVSEQTELQA